MEPRCTGMCGALATRPPSASKTAHEKSRRSLTLTDRAVFGQGHPHLLGDGHEAVVVEDEQEGRSASASAADRARAPGTASSSSSLAIASAAQPGSITVVLVGSQTIAGPARRSPGESSARRRPALDPKRRTRRGGPARGGAQAPGGARLRDAAPGSGGRSTPSTATLSSTARDRRGGSRSDGGAAAEGRGHRLGFAPGLAQGDVGARVLDGGGRATVTSAGSTPRTARSAPPRSPNPRRRWSCPAACGPGQRCVERQLHRALVAGRAPRRPHAVGAQHARDRVLDDRSHRARRRPDRRAVRRSSEAQSG